MNAHPEQKNPFYFSPLEHYYNLRTPLVYFFTTYQPAKSINLTYNPVETESQLLITSIDNYYEVKINEKPRILIDRGPFKYDTRAIDNSMYSSSGPFPNLGRNDSTKSYLISGTSNVKIQARNQGTCDALADMVSHFYMWTAPLLASTYGYLRFGQPGIEVSSLEASDTSQVGDSTTLFEVNISLPWQKEEMYDFSQAGVKLKSCFQTVGGNTTFIPQPSS